MNRTIVGLAGFVVAAAVWASPSAAETELGDIAPGTAAKRLCDDVRGAETAAEADAIFERADKTFDPIRSEYSNAQAANDRAARQAAAIIEEARDAIRKRQNADDVSLAQLDKDIEHWKAAAEEFDRLPESMRTNIVSNPHEVLHDRILEREDRQRSRATIDAMSGDAIRATKDFEVFEDRFAVTLADFSVSDDTIEKLKTRYEGWVEAMPRIYDCVEARKAEIEKEATGFTVASATGAISGKCSGFFEMMGSKKKNTWPLKASLQFNRDAEGGVVVALLTEERGQEMTLAGYSGPPFKASGDLKTIHMSIEGQLSDHPDQPGLLQGSGTGTTSDTSEAKISCSFAWQTTP